MLVRFRYTWLRRRLATLMGGAGLLLFVGAVVTRGPAQRDVASPVYLSRASGLAAQTGATNPLLAGNSAISGPYVTTVKATSFSGDVRQLPMVPRVLKDIKPELQANENERTSRAVLKDMAIQAPAGPSQPSQTMPRPLQNFPGLDFATAGTGYPPDTNGDVGPNHYVQVVNTGIGIFNKAGTLLVTESLDTFFQNAPAPCNAFNNGDPVVLYDAQHDRWIVSDFSWTDIDNGPHYECIASSMTGDPVSGGWSYYALRADDNSHPWLNDYPKLAVWPDGIYMSANMFLCNTITSSDDCSSATPEGVRVWAINQNELYTGATLHPVYFDTGSSYFSLLPSNLRGAAPPAGTPNYFVSNDQTLTALDVFKFHVDWVTPLNSTFSGPAQVVEAAYSAPPATVPELNGNALDSLGDRLMMQNQYRNISGSESLWIAHTAGNSPTNIAGIRWYQVDVTGGTINATPVQQSTYRPDSTHRWMPSLAVDKFGNMAVGYSSSSSSQFPDIRYAGRLVTDTLNTLGQSEAVLVSGTGAQTGSCGGATCIRWGDYSAMTLDPLDDCTFWYTTEYYAASGGDWQTRISSFRFPVCGPVPPPLTPQAYLPAIFINGNGGAGHWSTTMQEGFEGAWPSAGWQVTDPGFGEYFWAKRNCHASSGSYSAWAMGGGSQGQNLACGSPYINNANSWMVYGPFSLADATAADFGAKLWVNTQAGNDRVCLAASTDNFAATGGAVCLWGSSGGTFVPDTLDLSNVFSMGSLLGQPNVWVAVVFQSDGSNTNPEGAFVDDLLLRKCPGGTCPAVAGDALAGSLHQATASLTRPNNVSPAKVRP